MKFAMLCLVLALHRTSAMAQYRTDVQQAGCSQQTWLPFPVLLQIPCMALKSFTVRVNTVNLHRLIRKAVDAPSLELFQARLDGALSTLA